jgi:hypothetical protein
MHARCVSNVNPPYDSHPQVGQETPLSCDEYAFAIFVLISDESLV